MQGALGPTGAEGPAGIVDRWTSYRVITFPYDRAELSASDERTVSEVASYMAKNPSLRIGLDGHRDPANRTLSDRRLGTLRDALIVAGVPSYKIEMGAFGDPELNREQRVEMLVSTRPGA